MATDEELWAMIAEERLGLADLFGGLTEAQWSMPSLCEGWTVRDVAAHLVTPFGQSLPRLMLKLASYRFDFDRFAFTEARKNTMSGPELAASLRANTGYRFSPPGLGPIAPLTDAVVHGQDVRRPLSIGHELAPDRARAILDFLASPKATRGFVKRGHLDNLTWRCTDLEWSSGDGPVIAGPAEAVVLAMVGRSAAYTDLTGTGADVLRTR
ncbi:MAG TPA: maleylpyruvate isomerase family mycothiol-dependent enzyme [Acidimicrobiales bacterium]